MCMFHFVVLVFGIKKEVNDLILKIVEICKFINYFIILITWTKFITMVCQKKKFITLVQKKVYYYSLFFNRIIEFE